MPIADLFSKRLKRANSPQADVYQYDNIPRELRVQIFHIWNDVLPHANDRYSGQPQVYAQLVEALRREYGLFHLTEEQHSSQEELVNFFLKADSTHALDVIEITFKVFDLVLRSDYQQYGVNPRTIDDAIEELNNRFKEHGVGYQYASHQLIRIDSQFIHSEIVKPLLSLLSDKLYQGANSEFLSAHSHYRQKKYKECLNDCLKAFESTLKSICTKHKWSFASTDTVKALIDVIFTRNLIPSYLQSHFSGLRSTLEAGVPTIRNKVSGHGQGVVETEVPEHLAAYALHLTASGTLLLVSASKALK